MLTDLHLDSYASLNPSDIDEAFKILSELIESLGVMVMVNGVVGTNTRRKLDYREFRGFALSDPFAPLIFINGTDTRAAKFSP
ncbi:MAG: DNA-binding protein, partial [Actinomycetota bacterium]